jgi:hypothetical protein
MQKLINKSLDLQAGSENLNSLPKSQTQALFHTYSLRLGPGIMPKPKGRRTASHSGSWYEGGGEIFDLGRPLLDFLPLDPPHLHLPHPPGELLASQITEWLDAAAADGTDLDRVRAVIAPHAGYRYCGHVMAYAYKYLDPTQM